MDNVLATVRAIHDGVYIHTCHLTMPLTLYHLIKLNECLNTTNHHHLFHRVIYHNLRIDAQSPLIPKDKLLIVTINIIVYRLTPRTTDTTPRRHAIYLFLNPYKRPPTFSTVMM